MWKNTATSSATTSAALWQTLQQARLVQGTLPTDNPAAPVVPWYLRCLQGITGWIAALCLLIFIGGTLATLIFSSGKHGFFDSPGIAAFFGIPLCVMAAVLLRRQVEHAFSEQFAFALSLCGQALIGLSLFLAMKGAEDTPVPYLLLMGFFLLEFELIPNHLHRIWAMASAVLSLSVACTLVTNKGILLPWVVVMWSGLFAWLVLHRHRFPQHDAKLSPAITGVLWGLLTVGSLWLSQTWRYFLLLGHWGDDLDLPRSLFETAATFASGGVLLWVTWQLLRRYAIPPSSPVFRISLALALIVGISTYWMSGIACIALLLLLGFAVSDKVIFGTGVLTLLVYLNFYYYTLKQTLLVKAFILGGLGLVFILTYFLLPRLLGQRPAQPAGVNDHA